MPEWRPTKMAVAVGQLPPARRGRARDCEKLVAKGLDLGTPVLTRGFLDRGRIRAEAVREGDRRPQRRHGPPQDHRPRPRPFQHEEADRFVDEPYGSGRAMAFLPRIPAGLIPVLGDAAAQPVDLDGEPMSLVVLTDEVRGFALIVAVDGLFFGSHLIRHGLQCRAKLFGRGTEMLSSASRCEAEKHRPP